MNKVAEIYFDKKGAENTDMSNNDGQLIEFPQIKLGQTWLSKDPIGMPSDEIEICFVSGDIIRAKSINGFVAILDTEFLKAHYVPSEHQIGGTNV